MLDFCFLLKTYRNDFGIAGRLIDSFQKYNEDDIMLFLLCPKQDISMFQTLLSKNMRLIAEEEIDIEVFERDGRWSAGYMNQAIYKLAFGELGLSKNYMCLDSDAVFIRPFYFKDFMYDDNIPYTVLIEDNDLHADYYYQNCWESRRTLISKIEDALDFHPYKLLTCHGFQTFSITVLDSLKKDFMEPVGFTYKNLIEISPYEFSWYNLWLQKSQCMTIYTCEPFFKTFHLKQHHIFSVLQGMRIEDWARAYVGIILQSNFGVRNGSYDDLSLYNYDNSGIPDNMIYKAEKFYKKLKSGIRIQYIKGIIGYVCRKTN